MPRLRSKFAMPLFAITMAACTSPDSSSGPDVVDPFPPAMFPADASVRRSDAGQSTDARTSDSVHDAAGGSLNTADAEIAVVADASQPVDAEVTVDADANVIDAAIDAGTYAEVDAGFDSGLEAGTDGGIDAGTLDAGTDAGADAGRDASVASDAGTDAGTPVDAGSTPDTRVCTIKLTTSAPAGRYNPAYVCAIWVEDTNGKIVRTLAYFANRRATYLTAYKAALGTGTVDGTTSATINTDGLPNFDIIQHNLTWNMKGTNGVEVADGSYRVRVELTSKNGAGATTNIDLTKAAGAFGGTAADTVNTLGFAVSCPAAP